MNERINRMIILISIVCCLLVTQLKGFDFGAADFVRRYSANSHITHIPLFFKRDHGKNKKRRLSKHKKEKIVKADSKKSVKKNSKKAKNLQNRQADLQRQAEQLLEKINKLEVQKGNLA